MRTFESHKISIENIRRKGVLKEVENIINKNRIVEYELNESTFDRYLKKSMDIVNRNIDYFTKGFPHVSQNNQYVQEENKLWTASFFPGMAYLGYAMTQDDSFIRARQFYLDSFANRMEKGHMETHDIGFLYSLSCVALYKLTANKRAKDIALSAADKLVARYNPQGQYIQAWGKMGIGVPDVKIIIDCMMNLPLLYWASQETGVEKYRQIAQNHAHTSAKYLVREDGSTFHTYLMDPVSGRAIEGRTHQGRYDETTWARGQAWSLYGFTLSYMYTKDDVLLQKAIQSANYFINNQPENFVSYWDFSFTDVNPDIRDTSASAIAAAGLLELSTYVGEEQKELYEKTAKVILQQLCLHYFIDDTKEGLSGCGLLKEGMYHRDHGFNECTVWGDYFFMEALCKVKGSKVLFW